MEGVVVVVLNGVVEEVIDLVVSGRILNCVFIGGVEEVEGGVVLGVLVCGGVKNEWGVKVKVGCLLLEVFEGGVGVRGFVWGCLFGGDGGGWGEEGECCKGEDGSEMYCGVKLNGMCGVESWEGWEIWWLNLWWCFDLFEVIGMLVLNIWFWLGICLVYILF